MESVTQLLISGFKKDPNKIGEILREAIFVKKNASDYGCYSTFDLLPEFKEVTLINNSDLFEKLTKVLANDCDLYECDEDEFHQDYTIHMFSNGNVHVAWYWDSDGTLLLISEELKMAVLNDDCKKDYTWKFVNWS